MTAVLYEPGEYRLRVEGHAQATDEGFDPVCAGASALAWALVEAATNREDFSACLHIDPVNAVIDVRCYPAEAAEKDCRYMLEIIFGGLLLISEAYPHNMRIKIGGTGT